MPLQNRIEYEALAYCLFASKRGSQVAPITPSLKALVGDIFWVIMGTIYSKIVFQKVSQPD